MRIAINAWFADQPTTGSGQYLTHLLAEYAAHGGDDRYLLCGRADQSPPVQAAAHPAFEWQALRTPLDRAERHLAKLWFEQVTLPRACRRWGADVLHVPYWAAPVLPPAPTLVTVHDLIPLLLPAYSGGKLGKGYTRLVAWSARRATRVLTDSHASRRDIIEHLGIPAERVQTIHLAAEARFHPVDAPDELARVRKKYDLPADFLLYLGGFDVRKNVPGILRAFAQIDHPQVRLVIAGKLPARDTAFLPDPRRIAGELGIVDRVRFTQWVDEADKPAMMSSAIAFVFPSHYEGFGLPPLEAMSCGTPVIVSDRGSLPEIAGDGGLCVTPDDPGAIAAAMDRLITEPSLRERLRAAGLAQARRFDWERCARETSAAYRRAAGA